MFAVILEERKPPIPQEAAGLHYLLFSPFRYETRGARLVLLLVGGDKASQKRDISQAVSYLQDHRRRQ